MKKIKVTNNPSAYYQTAGNGFQATSTKELKRNIKNNTKGFGIRISRIPRHNDSLHRTSSEGKNSLSTSTSMIYKNSFYQSSQNHRREMMGRKESNHSYSTYLNNQRSAKRRKIKSREQKGLQIKITKLSIMNDPIGSRSKKRLLPLSGVGIGKRKK
ncbi:unnamed protein product [Moneuplotes crassus]|uniref:Uncharacterized protein n=1 Tax=Euplotes crassus TaxID=5936 RepID=A0AAD1TZH9_EUPCR|nr:unnamed protein product [Moneuplotes crassus]